MFTTKYKSLYPSVGISDSDFLVLSNEACQKLNWLVEHVSPYGLVAHTKAGIGFQEVIVRKNGDEIEIISKCSDNRLHDFGKNKKNVERFISAFEEKKESITSEYIAGQYEILKERFAQAEQDILQPELYLEYTKEVSVLSLFLPRKGYIVTPVIVYLNVLVFIIMLLNGVSLMAPTGEDILSWGGNFGPSTLNGEWWRIITCAFVHIGMVHLLMNMYALIHVGIYLEPVLGVKRYIMAYLLTAITSSLLSMSIHPEIVSAGASGAIFGMYGVFIAMLTTNILPKTMRKAVLPSMLIFVGYNLLYGMREGVDNAGHIGGLLGGLIIGYSLYPSISNQAKPAIKYATMAILTTAVVLASFYTFRTTPNSVKLYEEKSKLYTEHWQKFTDLEAKALAVYQRDENTPKDTLLYDLRDRGIFYWEQCEKELEEMDKLVTAPDAQTQIEKIREYCALRKESYNLMYKKIYGETTLYDEKISELDSAIASILQALNPQNSGS